jgi:hypothetical protein
MSLSPQLRSRVLEAAKREPSPVRSEVRTRLTLLVGASAAIVVGAFYALGGGHAGSRPGAFIAGTAVGWAGVAVAATWIAFVRGHSMLGRPERWLLSLTVGAPLALFAWALVWGLCYPATLGSAPPDAATRCFILTVALAVVPLVALSLARRESDPVHPRATGAALGAASGAWAGVMVNFFCPFASPGHVLTRHVLPVVLLILGGVVLGQRLIAVRSRE